jgi:hypothetical protein
VTVVVVGAGLFGVGEDAELVAASIAASDRA